MREAFWLWSMQVGLKGVHGDDDQIVPIDASARRSVELVMDATLKEYPGAPHGLAQVAPYKDQVNADLLAFLRA